jgi:ferrochelatase
VQDLERTIAGVLARLGGQRPWRLSFQSRAGKARWLEPSTDDVLKLLARTGRREILCVPISFVSDHIETLYEIDLLFGDEARALGLDFRRAPSLNTEPAFIEALAQLVEARIASP